MEIISNASMLVVPLNIIFIYTVAVGFHIFKD
jgi:hypothetical protein